MTSDDAPGSGSTGSVASIVGLGLSEQGRRLGLSKRELKRRALDAALLDAGLRRDQVDGVLTVGVDVEDLRYLGLAPRVAFTMSAGGATPGLAVLTAAGLVATGQCSYVACLYGETFSGEATRLEPNHVAGPAFQLGGYSYGYPYVFGHVGPASAYALGAQRYLAQHGLTSEDLGAIAVAERAYGCVRPGSVTYGEPITLDDHQASRMIADPLRLLDCSRPTDGGAAVIVTSSDRAADAAGTVVEVLGSGCGTNLSNWWTGQMIGRVGALPQSARRAYETAGVTAADIDVAQLYAPFTIATALQLEEYGFCGPGEAPAFVRDGQIGPKGTIPTNTGGGQHSGFYATGFTPLSEGVLQVRGQAPSNQVDDVELCLVSGSGGNGGIQGSWAHVSLVLGPSR